MMHRMMLGMAATGLLAAAPAAAQSSIANDDAEFRAAYAELKKVREAAAEALRKADEAIAIIERRRGIAPPTTREVADTSPSPLPQQTEFIIPPCDAPGEKGSIGSYMLDVDNETVGTASKNTPSYDTTKQKKESSYDKDEAGSDRGINAFVYRCLNLTEASQYEAITNLSVQFNGAKGNDTAELAVTRTARAVKKASFYNPDTKQDEPALAATYNRYRLGGFGRVGSNGEAPLIDLTQSSFASGVGVVAGFEWGRHRPVAKSKLRTQIHAGLAKARRDCFADYSLVDPLKPETASGADRPHIALNPLTMCEGDNFRKWLTDHSNKYWTDIVAPLWGIGDEKAETFAGIEARYAFQDVSYLPVIDPATGAVIVTTLPDAVTIHPEPYSVKLYGGFNRKIGDDTATIGMTGSLTYRREIDFLGSTSGRTLCSPAAPGATFDICDTDLKLAAPYDTKGFVGGLALDLQFKRFWQLPPVAMSPRLTYAFDTKRLGLELPLYLLTDSDGKLNSGVKYTCRFRGTTPEGFELKKTCSINLFVGTSFELGKSP